MDLSSTLARDCSQFYSLPNQGRSSSHSSSSSNSATLSSSGSYSSYRHHHDLIRLRRTVADRKRLLTKVIEGLGQHGMVGHDDDGGDDDFDDNGYDDFDDDCEDDNVQI